MFTFDSTEVTFDSTFWRFTGDPPGEECGNVDALTAQAIALLPRGRAWQTDEIGPRPGSVLYGYWRSFASLIGYANVRLCLLYNEFFCSTKSETEPEWMEEYGLPDACDPYPILCEKVKAIGGARCDDYVALADRAGWDIECIEVSNCGAVAGCGYAGCAVPGSPIPFGVLRINIYLASSPSFVPNPGAYPGCAYAGCATLVCPPDISGLLCILERVIHAHVAVEYVQFAARP